MKKATTIVSALLVLGALLPTAAFAATGTKCGDTNAGGQVISCENGNPENVQAYGGFTNSMLPHVMPGQKAADGSLCPMYFSKYCVDISLTPYYLALLHK